MGNHVPESYSESALRHSADADRLATASQLDGAGYLIGFAVECAIKSAIASTRPTAQAPHVHLPGLIERAKRALQGRQPSSIFKVIEQAQFMQGWSIDIRYAENGVVVDGQFQRWRGDANRAMAAANLRRRK
jgi:hypothetical protein